MIDAVALQMVLGVLTGWLGRREREAIAYLIEENRLLRRQLGARRLRLTDHDRRWLAARADRVGRAALRQIAELSARTFCAFRASCRRSWHPVDAGGRPARSLRI